MKELLKQIRDIQEQDRKKFKPVPDIEQVKNVEVIHKEKTIISKELSIGQKIRKIRESKGYKQDYVAKHLNIQQNSYSRIESGQSDIFYSKLLIIAKVFEMDISDIILFEESILNKPSRIESLLEDKIELLEEKIKYLQKELKTYERIVKANS